MESRKYRIALLGLLSATVLVGVGAIEGAVYGAVVGSVIAAYIAGNVAQKAMGQ